MEYTTEGPCYGDERDFPEESYPPAETLERDAAGAVSTEPPPVDGQALRYFRHGPIYANDGSGMGGDFSEWHAVDHHGRAWRCSARPPYLWGSRVLDVEDARRLAEALVAERAAHEASRKYYERQRDAFEQSLTSNLDRLIAALGRAEKAERELAELRERGDRRAKAYTAAVQYHVARDHNDDPARQQAARVEYLRLRQELLGEPTAPSTARPLTERHPSLARLVLEQAARDDEDGKTGGHDVRYNPATGECE